MRDRRVPVFVALSLLSACSAQWIGKFDAPSTPGGTVELQVDARYNWSVSDRTFDVWLCAAVPSGWAAPTVIAVRAPDVGVPLAFDTEVTDEATARFPVPDQEWSCFSAAPQQGTTGGNGYESGDVRVSIGIPADTHGRYTVTTTGGSYGMGVSELQTMWGTPTKHILHVGVQPRGTFENWGQESWSKGIWTILPGTVVAKGGGRFVATDGLSLYSSTDGEAWVAHEQASLNLAYGAGNWVLLREGAIGLLTFPTEEDVSFSERFDLETSQPLPFLGLVRSEDRFAAGLMDGRILTSLDGEVWEEAGVVSELQGLAASATQLLAFTAGRVQRSVDGITWQEAEEGGIGLISAAYGNGRWLALSDDPAGRLQESKDDGATWSLVRSFEGRGGDFDGEAALRVSFVDGRFVIGGTGSSIWVGSGTSGWIEVPTGYSGGLNHFVEDDDFVVAGGPWGFLTRAAKRAPPPEIRTTALPEARGGDDYSAPLDVAYGKGLVTLEIEPALLPPGITLEEDILVGSPTEGGSWTFTVVATDASGSRAEQELTIEVEGPSITPKEVPTVALGEDYEVVFVASGGDEPYSWSLSGPLPDGLSDATSADKSTLTISGAAEEEGAFPLQIVVEDSRGLIASVELELVVGSRPKPRAVELETALVGTELEAEFRATGGMKPYNFEWSGELPQGLDLVSERNVGRLVGTPKEAGEFTFRVKVIGADGLSANFAATTLTVLSPPLLELASELPAAKVGEAYSVEIPVSAGEAPFTWTHEGELPSGLTLSADGARYVLAGTPAKEGAVAFTVRVSDGNDLVASRKYQLEVHPAESQEPPPEESTKKKSSSGGGCASTGPSQLLPLAWAVVLVGLGGRRRLRRM